MCETGARKVAHILLLTVTQPSNHLRFGISHHPLSIPEEITSPSSLKLTHTLPWLTLRKERGSLACASRQRRLQIKGSCEPRTNSWMQKWIVGTVKRYSHQTTLQGFVDAMLHCANALCILHTLWFLSIREATKRWTCEFFWWFWLPIDKKRPVFLPRTYVFFSSSCCCRMKLMWKILFVWYLT